MNSGYARMFALSPNRFAPKLYIRRPKQMSAKVSDEVPSGK
jgi:hypothetical protein